MSTTYEPEPLADWERELLASGDFIMTTTTAGQPPRPARVSPANIFEACAECGTPAGIAHYVGCSRRAIHPVNRPDEPGKTYRILDLQWREEIHSGLTLSKAWAVVELLKWQNPAIRLDIRTEFS